MFTWSHALSMLKNVTCYNMEKIMLFPPEIPYTFSHENVSKSSIKMLKHDLSAWGVCLTFNRIALFSTSSSLIRMLAYCVLLPWMFTRNRAVTGCQRLTSLHFKLSAVAWNNFKSPGMYLILLEGCLHTLTSHPCQRSTEVTAASGSDCYITGFHLFSPKPRWVS